MKAVRQLFLSIAVAGVILSSIVLQAQATAGSQEKPAAAAPVSKQRTKAIHPKVTSGKECSDCHKKEVQQWDAGSHGVNQVKCLVCHGSIVDAFTPKPAVSRCQSCHAPFVAQLNSDPFMKNKTCFTCHPPHSLKPHASAASGGK